MAEALTRHQALACGARRYIGKACKHGHMSGERYTGSSTCCECHNGRTLRWFNENRAKRQPQPEGSQDVIRLKWTPQPDEVLTRPPVIVPEPPAIQDGPAFDRKRDGWIATANQKQAKRYNTDWATREGAPRTRIDRLEAQRHRQYPPLRIKKAAVTPLLMPLVDLGFDQCHYPYDRDAEGRRLFCGLQKVEKRSYCQEHCDLCFLPPDR